MDAWKRCVKRNDAFAQTHCSLTDVLLGKVAGTLSCKLGIIASIAAKIRSWFPSSSLWIVTQGKRPFALCHPRPRSVRKGCLKRPPPPPSRSLHTHRGGGHTSSPTSTCTDGTLASGTSGVHVRRCPTTQTAAGTETARSTTRTDTGSQEDAVPDEKEREEVAAMNVDTEQ